MRNVECWLLAFGFWLLAGATKAQYIPAWQPDSMTMTTANVEYWHQKNLLRHLEVSLTIGTTGIGIDIATPVCEYVQLRAGYDYMPRIGKKYRYNLLGGGEAPTKYDEQGNRQETKFDRIANYVYETYGHDLNNYIDLTGKLTMNNWKLLVDVYPLKYDKSWHITAGFYWGPSEFARMDQASGSEQLLQDMITYNKAYRGAAEGDAIKGYGLLSIGMGTYSHTFGQDPDKRLMNAVYEMEPSAEATVEVSCASNALKPYIGFGYGGRLLPKRNDWKVTGELGVLFWGGTPSQTTHDGINLSKDVMNYPNSITSTIKALKVWPVLSVRIAKTLF